MKKKKSGGGGANWMDTYGDMVTLLLCFFVLLYSMSTLDTQKWLLLVQSFNPDAILDQTEVLKGNEGPSADPPANEAVEGVLTQQDVTEALNELTEALQSYAEQNQTTESMSVTQGDGYVFIAFNDAVFFNGDSYVLREEGQVVLDEVCAMLAQASPAIDELRILGHTAQARENQVNEAPGDRFLASNRATNVTLYIQEKNILDPARLVSIGYGQWRPIADNTAEERYKNRRVEMIITGLDLESKMGDSIAQYYTERGTPPPEAAA